MIKDYYFDKHWFITSWATRWICNIVLCFSVMNHAIQTKHNLEGYPFASGTLDAETLDRVVLDLYALPSCWMSSMFVLLVVSSMKNFWRQIAWLYGLSCCRFERAPEHWPVLVREGLSDGVADGGVCALTKPDCMKTRLEQTAETPFSESHVPSFDPVEKSTSHRVMGLAWFDWGLV